MPELRPVLVFPAFHPRGGVERVAWEAMRHLSRHRPVSVVASHVEDGDVGHVTVHDVARVRRPRSMVPVLWRRAAARHLRGVDGLVVSFGVDCPVGDVLVVQSVHRTWLELGRPVPFHGVDVPPVVRHALPRHRVLLSLESSYFGSRRFRKVIAVSDNVSTDLQRFYRVPAERITVIPNGFSPEQCSPQRTAALRAQRRADLGLGEDDVALLLVANEWHRKGLGVLLEAMAEVGCDALRLLLVGRLAPDQYWSRIERLGLTGRVTYCGPTADVALFHAAADVFVMPTQYEAFGSVIVEALASGVPVITTALAGAAAAVQPDVNGLLQQDPDDAHELAGLLRRAVDPGVRSRWREAAPGSVQAYTWPSIMERIENVLLEVAR